MTKKVDTAATRAPGAGPFGVISTAEEQIGKSDRARIESSRQISVAKIHRDEIIYQTHQKRYEAQVKAQQKMFDSHTAALAKQFKAQMDAYKTKSTALAPIASRFIDEASEVVNAADRPIVRINFPFGKKGGMQIDASLMSLAWAQYIFGGVAKQAFPEQNGTIEFSETGFMWGLHDAAAVAKELLFEHILNRDMMKIPFSEMMNRIPSSGEGYWGAPPPSAAPSDPGGQILRGVALPPSEQLPQIPPDESQPPEAPTPKQTPMQRLWSFAGAAGKGMKGLEDLYPDLSAYMP